MRKILALVFTLGALVLASADAGDAPQQPRRKAIPEKVFRRLDTNADGTLTRDEFLEVAKRITDPAKAEKVKARLGRAYDKINHGEPVTLEQFKQYQEMLARRRGSAGPDAKPAPSDEKK